MKLFLKCKIETPWFGKKISKKTQSHHRMHFWRRFCGRQFFFSLATANGFWVWKKSKKFSINSTWLVIHWDDFQALADRVNTLMDHDQERKMDMKTWMLNNVLVVGFIKKVLGQPLDDHMIQRAIGLLKTNSVKLDAKPGYTTGSAIYPTFSYLNHNCVCNSRTKKYVDQNGVSF